ncbi:MAG: hypothetical protein AB7P33_10585 [Dehalococcoidia bacterium]
MQMRVSLPFALIVVGGLVVAAFGAALVVVSGSKGDDTPRTVVAATVVVPTSVPSATPAPTATPLPAPPPEPTAVPDRNDCAAIRADPAYRSETERLWFMANCSAPTAPSAPSQAAASAPSSSAAAQAPAAAAPAPPPPSGPRTVTVSLCDPANRGILLFTVTSGSFSYKYDATPSGLNIQPADLVSSLSIPNVPPGTYSYQANILGRNGSLLQSYNRTSDQDRIVSSPFC